MHRPMLVYRMPHLIVIDGIPVSDEERTKAEIYFMEQQVGKKLVLFDSRSLLKLEVTMNRVSL